MEGSGPHTGRVQISVDGVFGSVCAYGWGEKDAEVFCREKGYRSIILLIPLFLKKMEDINPFYEASDTHILDFWWYPRCQGGSLVCLLHYLHVMDYSDSPLVRHLLTSWRPAWQRSRLINCPLLCFWFYVSSSGVPEPAPVPSTGEIWLATVNCYGNETSFSRCPHVGWAKRIRTGNCDTHTQDAGVYCYGNG